MYGFLRSRRWLGLLVVGALVAVAFVRLGMWQLDRNEARAERNGRITAAAAADPVPVGRILGAGEAPAAAREWHPVSATGRYDTDRTLLVRNRVLDQAVGFHVLVPLVTTDGTALWVDRGWLPRGRSASDAVDVPPPPGGEVTVTGRIRTGERVGSEGDLERSDRPAPSVGRVDPARLSADLPYPAYGSYVERLAETPAPADAPVAAPAPETEPGPHLAYAVQWFLFVVVGVVGLVLLARREARERQAEHGSGAATAGPDAADRSEAVSGTGTGG